MGPIRTWLSQTEITTLGGGGVCQSHFAFDTRKFLETETGEWKGGRMSPDVGGQETRGQKSKGGERERESQRGWGEHKIEF